MNALSCKLRRMLTLAAAALSSGLVLACEDSEPTAVALDDPSAEELRQFRWSVTAEPESLTLVRGESGMLTAVVRDRWGRERDVDVDWTSADSIVKVEENGAVTALDSGLATVTATFRGASDAVRVVIAPDTSVQDTLPQEPDEPDEPAEPQPEPVASVAVTPASAVLEVGQTEAFTAQPRDANGQPLDGRQVIWSSSDSSVASVSQTGVATALRAGTTLIRATSEGQVGEAALTVTEPSGGGSSMAFESDWSYALGNTREAVTDGGTWPGLACERTFPATLRVMQASEVAFPLGGNVLRVQMRGPTDCGMLQKNDAVPISTTHWGRFYIRNDEVGTKNDHPVAYNNIHGSADIQGVPFARFANRTPAGQWQPGVVGDAPYPNNKWYGPLLENGRWYRYEWQMEYLSATETRVHPRIYDMDGTLLFDASAFVNDNGDYTLAQWYAAGGTITLANGGTPDAELARNFGMGNEGPGSSTATMGYWYYARAALSLEGWIGR